MSETTEWFQGKCVGGGTQKRSTMLPLIVWAIVIGLVLGAVLYSAKVGAQEAATYSAKDERGNLVRITLEPCPGTPAWLGLRKAEMRYEGIEFEACWFAITTTVFVLDSNGDATPIPGGVFEKDEGV